MLSACRLIVDSLMNLKSELGLPEHFMLDHPRRKPGDFDPNQYFDIFTHLDLTSGYTLDFVYFTDDLGGKPLVYARQTSSTPFRSYEGLLASFGEVITDEQGNWSWSSPEALEPGGHKLIVRYQNEFGQTETVEHPFTVLAAEESDLPSFTSTPSATLTPTISPTVTISPTLIGVSYSGNL